MALTTGSFTVHGASAGASVIATLTTDPYSFSLAQSVFGVSSGLAALQADDILTSSNNSYFASSSSVIVATPGMGGAIIAATAPATVLGGDGSALSFTGTSSSVVLSGNGNDTVFAAAGNDTIGAGAGNNTIILGTGNSFVESAGVDTITGGAGTDTVRVTNSASINAGTGGLSILGGGGNVTVSGINGRPVTIYGGSGSTETLIGSAHNNIFVANDSTKGAGGGSVVLNGASASGGNQFWAGSGNATLIGGTGNDTLVAGQGASTMTGGAGTNEFDFFTVQGGSGTSVTITDFDRNGASDTLKLFNYGTSAAGAAFADATTVGSNTMITLSDKSTITLMNFNKNSLTQNDIVSTPPNTTA